MILTCIIVEDREADCDLLTSFIKRIDTLALKGTFNTALDALQYLHSHTIDLIITDIMLPDISGLNMIKTLTSSPQVIFTTSYAEFAVEGFEIKATDYMVKPLRFERFIAAINKASDMHHLKAGEEKNVDGADHFFIRSDFSYVRINYADIIYIESVKDYLKVLTTGGEHHTPMSLKAIEDKLSPNDFIRVHRSFLVNMHKIDAVKNNEVVVAGHTVPVSESHRTILYDSVVSKKIIKKE